MANYGPYSRDEDGKFAPAGGTSQFGAVQTGPNTVVTTIGGERTLYVDGLAAAKATGFDDPKQGVSLLRQRQYGKGIKAEVDRFSAAIKPKNVWLETKTEVEFQTTATLKGSIDLMKQMAHATKRVPVIKISGR